MTGLILHIPAVILIINEHFVLAGLAFIVGSIMDTLDGRYSRMSGKGTMFGAFLDSTLDRIEEGVVLTAVAYFFADNGDAVPAAACVVTVLGSLMVSYTRAKRRPSASNARSELPPDPSAWCYFPSASYSARMS